MPHAPTMHDFQTMPSSRIQETKGWTHPVCQPIVSTKHTSSSRRTRRSVSLTHFIFLSRNGLEAVSDNRRSIGPMGRLVSMLHLTLLQVIASLTARARA